ncbi:MAG: PEP-CTERM sorting domain-containing protein [Kiritimatiellae bacterium]|nr:PEP-CTERM sorting domain-containing protein [Kiritimatiellia bacterium]
MKKIMFALLGAFMVANAHGAFVEWTTERDWNDAAPNATVYVFLLSDATTVQGLLGNAASGSAFATAVAGSSLKWSSDTANGRGVAAASLQLPDISAAGVSTDLYAVIVSGDNYYTTDKVSGTTSTAESAGTMADFDETVTVSVATAFSGSTPPPDTPDTDTPEPTSGVLMLVGAAMVALKRKQR